MTELSRNDVVLALGQVDGDVADEIIATGVTPIQLAEARVWVVMDRVLSAIGADRRYPVGEVGRAAAIIERLPFEEIPLAPEQREDEDIAAA